LIEAAIYQSKEILAAFEHTVFEKLYHSPEARKVSSVLSCRVLQKLSNDPNAIDTIFRWIGDHRLGAVTKSRSLNRTIARASHIGSISIRNFLPDLPDSISETEKDITKFLGAAGGNGLEFAVSVQRYAPPDSKYSIEPDHIYIDAFVLGGAKARQVTRLFQWVADKLDTRDADPDDYVMWLERPEINRNYEALLARAIELAWPGINLHRLTPWPLTRLGKFSDRDEGRDEVTLWLTSSDLNDKCTRHIVRRVSTVPRQLVAIRGEINGLAQLRSRLRSSWKKNRTLPRKRFFLITASVVLSGMKHEGTVEREFDGGLLEISARTGAANLYLLETKGRGTAARAANELTSKLRALNLRGTVTKLKNHSAFATISLS